MTTPAQRMFNGQISATALADQLVARFSDRQHHAHTENSGETSLVQIGSKHGTPLTLHITDTSGGVLITMGRERNWLDKTADASELIERAATNPLSLLAMIPDVLGEMNQGNLAPQIWDAINDICALTRSLSGEKNAPHNPKVCEFCATANEPALELCAACGAVLPSNLPRQCPKCGRGHTSEALFCQACGTRLVAG